MAESRQQTYVAKGMAETLALVSCQSRRTGDRARRKGFVVVHRRIHKGGFGFDDVEAVLATTMQCLGAVSTMPITIGFTMSLSTVDTHC
jgi:hypothetical protein